MIATTQKMKYQVSIEVIYTQDLARTLQKPHPDSRKESF
jgi:hypothetical protein